MKLEVGMYVRTNMGDISKIKSIWENERVFFEDKVDIDYFTSDSFGISYLKRCKASHNIIDLIEEDDLIKCQFGEQILILQVGARYTTSHQVNDWVKGVFTPDNDFWSLKCLDEEDILQSIVTKEQFESMSYKL